MALLGVAEVALRVVVHGGPGVWFRPPSPNRKWHSRTCPDTQGEKESHHHAAMEVRAPATRVMMCSVSRFSFADLSRVNGSQIIRRTSLVEPQHLNTWVFPFLTAAAWRKNPAVPERVPGNRERLWLSVMPSSRAGMTDAAPKAWLFAALRGCILKRHGKSK